MPKEHEKQGNWKDSEGFFCSSLVAASYMSLGIMPVKYTSGRYLPGKILIISMCLISIFKFVFLC